MDQSNKKYVHIATCSNCNCSLGRDGDGGQGDGEGEWHPAREEDEGHSVKEDKEWPGEMMLMGSWIIGGELLKTW